MDDKEKKIERYRELIEQRRIINQELMVLSEEITELENLESMSAK